ncbi:hypothetical protein V8C34DRAFT_326292 [Trichoderma compactum]
MDFALGPNQGQGVPAEPDDQGLQWDLIPYSVTVAADSIFNGTLLSNVSWSPTLLPRFHETINYSLKPFLPLIQAVLADGYREYLGALVSWTHSLGLRHRSQVTYNLPMDMEASIPYDDVPECESLQFRNNVDAYRQFSGSAQLAGKNVVSVKLGAIFGFAFSYTLTDLVFAVNRAISGGVNRVVIHGQSYTGIGYLEKYARSGLPILLLGGEPGHYPSHGSEGREAVKQEIAKLKRTKSVHIVAQGELVDTLRSLKISPRIRTQSNGTWWTTWREDIENHMGYAFVYGDDNFTTEWPLNHHSFEPRGQSDNRDGFTNTKLDEVDSPSTYIVEQDQSVIGSKYSQASGLIVHVAASREHQR